MRARPQWWSDTMEGMVARSDGRVVEQSAMRLPPVIQLAQSERQFVSDTRDERVYNIIIYMYI